MCRKEGRREGGRREGGGRQEWKEGMKGDEKWEGGKQARRQGGNKGFAIHNLPNCSIIKFAINM